MRKNETLEEWQARSRAEAEQDERLCLSIARIGIITDQVREMIAIRRENYRTQPGAMDSKPIYCSRCTVLERENTELRAIIHAGTLARRLLKDVRSGKTKVRSEP